MPARTASLWRLEIHVDKLVDAKKYQRRNCHHVDVGSSKSHVLVLERRHLRSATTVSVAKQKCPANSHFVPHADAEISRLRTFFWMRLR